MSDSSRLTWYRSLILAGLLLAVALALISVHLRLVNSGLGCADWPDCYGRLAGVEFGADSPAKAIAVQAHRILASLLGLIVLAIGALALWLRTSRAPAAVLFGVMLMLALLGRWSAGLTVPAIVLTNFGGGLLMAALLWWMWRASSATPLSHAPAGALAWLATALLILQLALGGLVSAFFAALACGPAFNCGAPWTPGIPSVVLSGLLGPLELDAGGRVIIGSSLTGLHMTHRLLGFALIPVLGWLAYELLRNQRKALAGTMLALAVVTSLGGIAIVRFALPPLLVLAHYALALCLLLTTLSACHPASAISGNRAR